MEITWRENLAWCACLIDGEGHIRTDPRDAGATLLPRIDITQADRRVLDRFRRIIGMGRIYGPYHYANRVGHKPRFQYYLAGYQQVQAAIAMIWTWLDVVKRQQAGAAMIRTRDAARLAPGRGRDKTICKRGHSLTDPSNVHIYIQHGYQSRDCRACGAERMRISRRLRHETMLRDNADLDIAWA